MRILLRSIFILGTVILVSSSCKKDKDYSDIVPKIDTTKLYEIPASYNFKNVNYSGQTQRLLMLDEMVVLMKTGNTSGISVDALKLKNMYANTNNAFASSLLNSSEKRIKDKVYSLEQSLFESHMDSLSLASNSINSGSNGKAGVIVSNDGNASYLFDKSGVEYTQFVEKGLMGALMYYQICEVYLSPDKIGNSVDNTTVISGEGTAMEHHWDEAFGYFGAPIDFPENVNGIKYIARYTNSRNQLLNCNKKIMEAFIKGRAAISNKDYSTRDTQVLIIKQELEKVFAATAISYLNKAKTFITDDAIRNHNLSEGIMFAKALMYNSSKKITNPQLQQVMMLFGDNFYNTTIENINSARDILSSVYELNAIKTQL
jgi:hypothetical protein